MRENSAPLTSSRTTQILAETTAEVTPIPHRKIQAAALCLGLALMLGIYGLWRGSIMLENYAMEEAARQTARQTLERLIHYLESSYQVLETVSITESQMETDPGETQNLAVSLMERNEALRAIYRTDLSGEILWAAPAEDEIDGEQLRSLLNRSRLGAELQPTLAQRSSAVTATLDIPGFGGGFIAIAPVYNRRRPVGFVMGRFDYRHMMNSLIGSDVSQTYDIAISNMERTLYPNPFQQPGGLFALGPSPEQVSYSILIGDQFWKVTTDIPSTLIPGLGFTSMIILGLGLGLTLLVSLGFYRWLLRNAQLRREARASRSHLEQTGLDLVELQNELDLILNSVEEGVVLYDRDLRPIQVNAAFLGLFEMREEDPELSDPERHHQKLIALLGSEARYRAVFNNLRRDPYTTYTDELITPSSEDRPMRVFLRRGTTIIDAEGEARGMLVIYQDQTAMREIERAKDEFLSGVTHELRSPLASIKGFAQTIKLNPEMPESERHEFINIIEEETTRLQTLIEELLDLRRMEAGGLPMEPTNYDFQTLVEEVVRSTRAIMLSKQIEVALEWEGGERAILRGDLALMGRALRNLLVNAAKYSPLHGRIWIKGYTAANHVALEVQDEGPGINEKDLPHIFDRFYRGKKQGRAKGTGLGLAIVKHTIESHGGHIGVRSEPWRGATFRIELPHPEKIRPAKTAMDTENPLNRASL